MNTDNRTISCDENPGERLLSDFKDHLEAERVTLIAEIGSYPGPIPACDAQFNYLLEKRTRLSAQLHLVEQLLERCREHNTDDPVIAALISKIGRMNPEMTDKLVAVLGIDSER